MPNPLGASILESGVISTVETGIMTRPSEVASVERPFLGAFASLGWVYCFSPLLFYFLILQFFSLCSRLLWHNGEEPPQAWDLQLRMKKLKSLCLGLQSQAGCLQLNSLNWVRLAGLISLNTEHTFRDLVFLTKVRLTIDSRQAQRV